MEILIVDDEPQVAEMLARSLNREGHRTTIAHSGHEALQIVGRTHLDALFRRSRSS
jgi:two-component system OmpR family response regulator